MKTKLWFQGLSKKQRIWLLGTIAISLLIIIAGFLIDSKDNPKNSVNANTDMSIRQIAPDLGVTGKNLARELDLPLNISKTKSLKKLGVTNKKLQHVVHHLLSHRSTTAQYFVFIAIVLWGLVFLTRLGRPDKIDFKHRSLWYPRSPYIISLLSSVIIAGFVLGKSPNPMESIVKVFKSMVGLYPDPIAKVIALVFFILLAVIGNKLICGWACPFGAIQELIYSLPIFRKIKQKKLPFLFTNTIRGVLLFIMLLFLAGIIGERKGFVIYHHLNPFNLFDLDFESLSILLTVIIVLSGSFIIYRPFCQLICPFGFVSWIAERFSINRIRIDKDKCTQCGACIKACPLEAAKGQVAGNRLPADCFSCMRCLNVCPVDAIQYTSVFKNGITKKRST